MKEQNPNVYNEHTTIFNGLLYNNSSEGDEFRRTNDLLKEKNPDQSWKRKTQDDRILLKKFKTKWKSFVNSLPLNERPRHA